MDDKIKTKISLSLESFPDKYYTMPISKREIAVLRGQQKVSNPTSKTNQEAPKQNQTKTKQTSENGNGK